MPDDAHLARIEERLESFRKQLDQHEALDDRRFSDLAQAIRDEFAAFDKLTKLNLEAYIQIQDAKAKVMESTLRIQDLETNRKLDVQESQNAALRKLAMALLLAGIVGLGGWLFTNLSSNHPARYVPPLPPYHSSEEPRERNPR